MNKWINRCSNSQVIFIFVIAPFALSGCTVTKNDNKFKLELDVRHVGIITSEYANDGCPWLVKYEYLGQDKYLVPVQLLDQFKKSNSEIEFSFRLSRISQAECKMGQPALLEGVELR
jgi:hypothetical protein